METSITVLRKMTLKSKMSFGKFTNHTIESILKENKGYLIWLYYNNVNITFIDEILDILNIEITINKPGKDENYWREYKKEHETRYTTRQGYMFIKANRKISKDKIRIANSTNQNMAKLAWYNQGHR